MKIYDVIRAAMPQASADLCEHIIWGRTPYPCGQITAKSLYRAAHGFKRATDGGRRLCDCCNRLAIKNGLCARCRITLNAHAD